MPFTLAHPIAILPLWKASQRRLDLPALAIGAAIPDISYFVALRPVPNIGHSLLGILIQGIPSSILLLLIGRYLLWDMALALLPRDRFSLKHEGETSSPHHPTHSFLTTIAYRIPPSSHYSFWPAPRLITIILSIAIGALTHGVWDSATHIYGWTVVRASWLSAFVGPLPVYKWLQHSGGVIGLALLFVLSIKTLHKRKPQYQPLQLSIRQKRTAWLAIGIVTALVIWQAVSLLPPEHGFSSLIVASVIGLISGSFLGICLYATCFWSRQLISRQ